MYPSSNTAYYYFMDYSADKVYILNAKWKWSSFKAFNYPEFMITTGNGLNITGDSNMWKLDQDRP